MKNEEITKKGSGKLIETRIIEPDFLLSWDKIVPLHKVKNKKRLSYLVNEMKSKGWVGRPLLVVKSRVRYKALTGSHRYAAARKAKIEIPVLVVEIKSVLDSSDRSCLIKESYDFLPNADDDAGREEALKELYDLGAVSEEALILMKMECEANENIRLPSDEDSSTLP
jgi:hypothetical protein